MDRCGCRINQGCRGLVPIVDMNVNYFRYQLSALHDNLQSLGAGSTFQELSTEALATIRLVNPNLETQRAVVELLDEETARADSLIDKQRHVISLLSERRDALITAAVTGQMEMPGTTAL